MSETPAHELSSRTPCLEVREFVRHYSGTSSVGPISFDVAEGEFFSLLGPSGCGKSTTLRAIAGFETVDSGEIRLLGKPIHNTPPNKRGVGLVFQRHALFPHLTVLGNVAFGLRQAGISKAEASDRARAGLELVGLKGFEDRWPAQLSGGQQQRVAVARSLVMEPPLLLLDEPMSSLDLKLRVQMREELRRLQKRLKKTTIFVTHDQNEALAMSDRIAVLSDGRIEQIGTPRDIYFRPKTKFVAGFIGTSNQLEIVQHNAREGTRIGTTREGLELRLPDSAFEGQVTAIIRPEAIRLSAQPSPSAANSFKARITDTEFLGDEVQWRVVTDHGVELTVTRKTAVSDETEIASRDCHVSIDPTSIYLLA